MNNKNHRNYQITPEWIDAIAQLGQTAIGLVTLVIMIRQQKKRGD